jgi:hypothetical protein
MTIFSGCTKSSCGAKFPSHTPRGICVEPLFPGSKRRATATSLAIKDKEVDAGINFYSAGPKSMVT